MVRGSVTWGLLQIQGSMAMRLDFSFDKSRLAKSLSLLQLQVKC